MNKKILAVVEVTTVFALTMLALIFAGLSPVGVWVRNITHRAFVEYIAMIAVPALVLLITRRNFTGYGILFTNMKYHLAIVKDAIGPIAVSCLALALVNYREWGGSLIMVAVQVALLYVLGQILKRKPAPTADTALAGAAFFGLAGSMFAKFNPGNAFSALVFYVFFLGVGEELLFRGYIQSRLNAAFGKPFTLFNVQWGWGAIIASALFGIMHILNLGSLANDQWVLTPWWGLWTFFGGLVFAYIREKTGSIAAPTILHGLPQGLAYAIMGL
jgi:membrane protease YdiL (CAAX protease family)